MRKLDEMLIETKDTQPTLLEAVELLNDIKYQLRSDSYFDGLCDEIENFVLRVK